MNVYVARDATHAHLLVARLLEVGIHAEVSGEHLQGLLGEIPMGWATSPTILVPEQHGRRAAWFLQQLDAGRDPALEDLPAEADAAVGPAVGPAVPDPKLPSHRDWLWTWLLVGIVLLVLEGVVWFFLDRIG